MNGAGGSLGGAVELITQFARGHLLRYDYDDDRLYILVMYPVSCAHMTMTNISGYG